VLFKRIDINAVIEYNAFMTQITIRNVDEGVRLKLRVRAAAKGRSLEAELRDIITRAASEAEAPLHVGRSIRQRFQSVGGVELSIPARSKSRAVPDFK
jgi:antitoxin FitA